MTIRHYPPFSPIIFYALFQKEVKRFMSVPTQTVIAPMITSMLFFAVFSLALGRSVQQVGDYDFSTFIMPGLIIMGMLQNSFANASSSLMISKMQRNLVDVLMSPITSFEFVLAFTMGAITRGLMVGTLTYFVALFFVDLPLHSIGIVLFFGIGGTMMMGLLGFLGGIVCEKFDQISAFTNFIVVPLSFLSGTFYSINRLPEIFQQITLFNPFFYLIDGFRAGFLNNSEASLPIAMTIIALFNIILFSTSWYIVAKGWKIRS